MNTKKIAALAALIVVLAAGYAVARPASGNSWGGMMGGYGNGMMGNYGNGVTGGLGSMMGQYAGMMSNFGNGVWNGMMGGGNGYCGAGYTGSGYGANTTPITIDQAKDAVQQYLASAGNSDLKLSEVIEFDNNFYAGVKEQSTGKHAFELLVNKYTGAVFPEMGPNMMWNTKYGHMKWNTSAQASISEEQALKDAQDYLDKALPGIKVGDADAFYGYYTIEVLKDGKIYGMLSVNSNTGSVWYHSWHGSYVKILEVQ